MRRIIVLVTVFILSIATLGCENEQISEDNPSKNEKEVDKKDENEEKETEKKPYLESTIVENEEGLKIVTNPDDILVLSNKERNLPADYEPDDLIAPDIPFVAKNSPVRFMRKVAGRKLEELFAAGEEAGFIFYGRSGYRSYEVQKSLFDKYAEANGEEAANKFSAKPGQSEHQTGLVMDVTSDDVNRRLTEAFGQTEGGKWIKENAHKFGFIIRYPKGKEDITGYQYEPWHLRYVGEDTAGEIYDLGITLEEYFKDY